VFDRLSGKTEKHRQPEDLIKAGFLAKIEKKLAKLQLIIDYVNKYLAHAADPINRKSIDRRKRNLTYSKLEQAYAIIIQIGLSIADIVGETLIVELSAAPFDQFENWDRKLIDAEAKTRLLQIWEQRQRQIRSWGTTK
jgi:hypothetical protein